MGLSGAGASGGALAGGFAAFAIFTGAFAAFAEVLAEVLGAFAAGSGNSDPKVISFSAFALAFANL